MFNMLDMGNDRCSQTKAGHERGAKRVGKQLAMACFMGTPQVLEYGAGGSPLGIPNSYLFFPIVLGVGGAGRIRNFDMWFQGILR